MCLSQHYHDNGDDGVELDGPSLRWQKKRFGHGYRLLSHARKERGCYQVDGIKYAGDGGGRKLLNRANGYLYLEGAEN